LDPKDDSEDEANDHEADSRETSVASSAEDLAEGNASATSPEGRDDPAQGLTLVEQLEYTANVPRPESKPDPEMERIKAQLELLQKEKDQKEAAAKQRAYEDKIRKDAEEAFTQRMEEMRKAQEEAKKEIERAKADA